MAEHDEVIEGEALEPHPDDLPVLAEVRALAPAAPGGIPAVHAAAMTAGGFVAGAFAMAVVKKLAARRLSELAPPGDPASWPVGAARTYVVNVRLVSRSTR